MGSACCSGSHLASPGYFDEHGDAVLSDPAAAADVAAWLPVAPVEWIEIFLKDLCVYACVPPQSSMTKMGSTILIQGPEMACAISEADEFTALDMDAQATNIAHKYDGVTNFQKENLVDGYIIKFENAGLVGTNYWVSGLRSIVGMHLKVVCTGSTSLQQENAASFCRSLHWESATQE